MGTLLQDVKYGLRMLARSAGFTTVAVLTLALGIGANTAIFGLVNAVLLRPLPFRDPSRLVMVWEGIPQIGFDQFPFSAPDLTVYEQNQKSLAAVGTFQNRGYELSGEGEPERVEGARVSATLFPLLGVPPLLGRTFTSDEDLSGRHVVLLSYGLWQRRYGSDPAMVGKTIQIDRQPYSVVGVMPASFQFPVRGPRASSEPAALWVPMAFTPDELQGWGNMFNNSVLARLRPGVTLAQAQSEAAALAGRIQERYPAALLRAYPTARLRLIVDAFHEEVVGDVRAPLGVLLGAVGLVLLIACANVATLLLARAERRQKEIAVRSALGASRRRVVRQLLAENLVLSLLGGLAGWLIAFWGNSWLLSLLPSDAPLPRTTSLGGIVFGFALLLSVLACLLFGLAPAMLAWRTDLRGALHESGRSGTLGRQGRRLQGIFVTTEFALALVLLVSAGLLLKSFVKLLRVDPGFRPDHVLTLSVALPAQSYPKAAQVRSFYQQLLDRLGALPAVEWVGIANDLPLHAGETDAFQVEGYTGGPDSSLPAMHLTWVLGDYLRVMGIPLVRGRLFTPQDRNGSLPVVIVSERMARQLWPGQDPLGKRIRWAGRTHPWQTVVGVVGDVKDSSLGRTPKMHAYTPYLQESDTSTEENIMGELRSMGLSLRTRSGPASLASAVTESVHALDHDLAVSNVHTMEADVRDSVAPQRFNTFLVGLFAGLAVFLSAVGIYGVIAYAVSEQTHEIGIRMALGATRGKVLRLVVGQGLMMTFIGIGTGLAGALVLTRFLSSLLYGVKPTDPPTFIVVSLLLTGVAFLGSYIPARRATKVDPMVALRYE